MFIFQQSGSIPRFLIEQHRCHFRVLDIIGLAIILIHRKASLHSRTGLNSINPPLEMRELRNVLPLPLPQTAQPMHAISAIE